MKLVTLSSSKVLRILKNNPNLRTCHVANSDKQLYTLDIFYIDPEGPMVEVRSPRGRTSPIDSSVSWDLSFRDKKGAYQARVKRVTAREQSLVFFLDNFLFFLARREIIRLPADSRSPTRVDFLCGDKRHHGFLVDFNPEGLGINVEKDFDMEVGQEIMQGSFELRSQSVAFNAARIRHTAFTEDGVRLGLQFQDLSEDQRSTMKQVFDKWYVAQRSSFSIRDEG